MILVRSVEEIATFSIEDPIQKYLKFWLEVKLLYLQELFYFFRLNRLDQIV